MSSSTASFPDIRVLKGKQHLAEMWHKLDKLLPADGSPKSVWDLAIELNVSRRKLGDRISIQLEGLKFITRVFNYAKSELELCRAVVPAPAMLPPFTVCFPSSTITDSHPWRGLVSTQFLHVADTYIHHVMNDLLPADGAGIRRSALMQKLKDDDHKRVDRVWRTIDFLVDEGFIRRTKKNDNDGGDAGEDEELCRAATVNFTNLREVANKYNAKVETRGSTRLQTEGEKDTAGRADDDGDDEEDDDNESDGSSSSSFDDDDHDHDDDVQDPVNSSEAARIDEKEGEQFQKFQDIVLRHKSATKRGFTLLLKEKNPHDKTQIVDRRFAPKLQDMNLSVSTVKFFLVKMIKNHQLVKVSSVKDTTAIGRFARVIIANPPALHPGFYLSREYMGPDHPYAELTSSSTAALGEVIIGIFNGNFNNTPKSPPKFLRLSFEQIVRLTDEKIRPEERLKEDRIQNAIVPLLQAKKLVAIDHHNREWKSLIPEHYICTRSARERQKQNARGRRNRGHRGGRPRAASGGDNKFKPTQLFALPSSLPLLLEKESGTRRERESEQGPGSSVGSAGLLPAPSASSSSPSVPPSSRSTPFVYLQELRTLPDGLEKESLKVLMSQTKGWTDLAAQEILLNELAFQHRLIRFEQISLNPPVVRVLHTQHPPPEQHYPQYQFQHQQMLAQPQPQQSSLSQQIDFDSVLPSHRHQQQQQFPQPHLGLVPTTRTVSSTTLVAGTTSRSSPIVFPPPMFIRNGTVNIRSRPEVLTRAPPPFLVVFK